MSRRNLESTTPRVVVVVPGIVCDCSCRQVCLVVVKAAFRLRGQPHVASVSVPLRFVGFR